ncbi:DNA-binding transcriptional LysR family regulator [Hasllibacter halocynthiae]|uniref:DNA-binding transcriptional LysR family regulator n=1 Tax=Hasllibacter halocynthiae TaxID=595589 RepID=A0A2T0X9W7_9RHOB|nr:LysR family transcriptional regulator [Hasllibacter halocynthiae]PRY95740.1 DNA-binding transcriptional LysR family regulator [Hasllibacter halocynthiae]
MRPPLTALRAFEAVIRHRGIAPAAESLSVSQSAISHQLRHLERWFDGPLFDRSGGRTQPLPHALELGREIGEAFGRIERACDRARAVHGTQPLVVAAIPSIAVCWLIPKLGTFRAAHPNVPIRIVYALFGHEVDLRSVHLAFVYAEGPPGPDADFLLPGHSVPVANPAVATKLDGAAPDPAKADLLHDTDTSGWARWFGRTGRGCPGPLGGPVFEDFNLLRAAALAGQGCALCPREIVRPDIERGHLVPLSDVHIYEGFDYYLVSRGAEDAHSLRAASLFRDWILASL